MCLRLNSLCAVFAPPKLGRPEAAVHAPPGCHLRPFILLPRRVAGAVGPTLGCCAVQIARMPTRSNAHPFKLFEGSPTRLRVRLLNRPGPPHPEAAPARCPYLMARAATFPSRFSTAPLLGQFPPVVGHAEEAAGDPASAGRQPAGGAHCNPHRGVLLRPPPLDRVRVDTKESPNTQRSPLSRARALPASHAGAPPGGFIGAPVPRGRYLYNRAH